MMEPGEQFVPGGKPKSITDFARKRLKGAEIALAFVIITTVITSLTGIIFSGFSRVLIDDMLSGQNPGWFWWFIGGLSLITIIELAAEWINAIYSLKLDGKMAVIGSSSYMWKVLRLPMEFFSQRMAGDIQLRKESNETISGEIINTIAPLALDTAKVVFLGFKSVVEIKRIHPELVGCDYADVVRDSFGNPVMAADCFKGLPDRRRLYRRPCLDENDNNMIKIHTSIGSKILEGIREQPQLATCARWHHERFDGAGYPDRLAGNDIPEEVRIVAVADAYDAMTSKRSYRDVMPQKQVRDEIEKGIGTQFDPRFSEIMLKMIDEDTDFAMREKEEET